MIVLRIVVEDLLPFGVLEGIWEIIGAEVFPPFLAINEPRVEESSVSLLVTGSRIE